MGNSDTRLRCDTAWATEGHTHWTPPKSKTPVWKDAVTKGRTARRPGEAIRPHARGGRLSRRRNDDTYTQQKMTGPTWKWAHGPQVGERWSRLQAPRGRGWTPQTRTSETGLPMVREAGTLDAVGGKGGTSDPVGPAAPSPARGCPPPGVHPEETDTSSHSTLRRTSAAALRVAA